MNVSSWQEAEAAALELAKAVEKLAPGAAVGIAISSSLLALCAVGCLCQARLRLRALSRTYEEKLRLVSVGNELNAFDTDENAAMAASASVPSQFASTITVNGKQVEYDPDL